MSSNETKVPGLPNPGQDPEGFLRAINEIVGVREGARGNPLDRGVTFRDLVDAGLAAPNRALAGKGRIPASQLITPATTGAAVGTGIKPTLTTPPKPLGVAAVGTFATVLVTWLAPEYANNAYAEILRADTNDIGQAVVIGSSVGGQYADAVGETASKYYWVRFVSTSGIKGPASAGVNGKTALSPEFVMANLLATTWAPNTNYSLFQYVQPTVPNGMLYRVTQEGTSGATEPEWPTVVGQTKTDGTVRWTAASSDERIPFVIGTVNGQPAVVMDTAYIGDATITAAKIKEAFLDNLTAIHGTLNFARIEQGNIFELTIGGEVRSTVFSPYNNTGFVIRNEPGRDVQTPGSRQYVAEFYGDALFSGDVYGARLMGGIVVASRYGVPSDADNGSYEYICYYEIVSSQVSSGRSDSYTPDSVQLFSTSGSGWSGTFPVENSCYGIPGIGGTQVMTSAGVSGSNGPFLIYSNFIGYIGYVNPFHVGVPVPAGAMQDVADIRFIKPVIRTNPLDIISWNANAPFNYKRYRHRDVAVSIVLTRDSDLGLTLAPYLSTESFKTAISILAMKFYAGNTTTVIKTVKLAVARPDLYSMYGYSGPVITLTHTGGGNYTGVITGVNVSGTIYFKSILVGTNKRKIIAKSGGVINIEGIKFSYADPVGLSLELSVESIGAYGNIPAGLDVGFAFISVMDNTV